ncbi:P4a precursor [Eastern grey kangaroopox virus]|uniref:P4a n=1 Tax=Eastern grey kangaroopox virus TaxID=2042482 RepID=A0A2C9DT77_9POXV|nr:P4a precursor [Eastern grey kangaroopox virus]ATI21210.1 P4a precursor [Eastern grey kangaroopox virus]ATX75117.1 P4a precursor [Eastern grey kangaroopox virus]
MMPINNVVTLDQFESSEYLFKLLTSILPSLCLDYKVDRTILRTFVHGFDVIHNDNLLELVDDRAMAASLQQLGINYLLSRSNTSTINLFPVVLSPGEIVLSERKYANPYTNPIPCSLGFTDMPLFTRELLVMRTSSFEAHARYFGGYVRPEGPTPEIRTPFTFPDFSFENNYLHTLTYPYVVGDNVSTFKARTVDGIMVPKDLYNLLNVRALLDDMSRPVFDRNFRIEEAAERNNVRYVVNPVVDTELTTMPFKYLLMFFQHFSMAYHLRVLTYRGYRLESDNQTLVSFLASLRYQEEVKYLKQANLGVRTADSVVLTIRRGNRLDNEIITIPGVEFLIVGNRYQHYITMLSMVARMRAGKQLVAEHVSLFWDGIEYEEYKRMKFTDMLFYGSACYLFALYDRNDITYCSMLNDVLRHGETPRRICVLPRFIYNRTIPQLVAEILESINSISIRDFPRYDARDLKHIGLSDNGFMQFFQMLRLVGNKPAPVAVKEVMMAYAGIKMADSGPPYHINSESYRTFVMLLFRAMGFSVAVNSYVVSSHNYTTYSISPRVSKQHLTSMLAKASCSQSETEKLLSSAHDLVSFMLSVGRSRDRFRSASARRFYGGASGAPDGAEPPETTVQFVTPINILDRINVKGILSATALNEMVEADLFMPENLSFRHNLDQLIESRDLSGRSITHIMPLSMLDRLVTSAGAGTVSVGDLINNIDESAGECDATNELVEMINSALRDNYARDATQLTAYAINSVAASSEKQMTNVRRSTCRMAGIFKDLAMSIYAIERIFKAKLSDEVKAEILEKYKEFTDLSRSLYQDLIALEHLKTLLYIIKRSGRSIDDTEIGPEEIRRSYELVRPKIVRLTTYYNEINRAYFEHMKKLMNLSDSGTVTFDTE